MQSDTLSTMLELVGVSGTVFCRAEVGAPWALSTRGATSAIFHVIVRGAGYVRVGKDAPEPWRAGDVLLLPRGDAHVMSDSPKTPARAIAELAAPPGADGLPCVRHGGSGPGASILCGTLRFGPDAEELLLGALPPLLHVRSGGAASAWLDATLRLLSDEVDGARAGADIVVSRLADVLLVHALRTWLAEEGGGQRGWLGALSDPVLSRALAHMHREPGKAWTAASLARASGASRSVLYERFTERLGESPAAYLTRWRMSLAQRALARKGRSLSEVASEVGYESEAAFSRAFKRVVGSSPSAFRDRRAT
jgi:AraC-like DNA-binding protein